MKKVVFFLIIFLSFITNIEAKELVTLNKCVDGDTAWFNLNNEIIKVRFLAIDTPESTNEIEAYGKEASFFTCNELTNAKKIEIEYDDFSDKLDKYDRHLVWVFVDDNLLQEKIINNGLAEVKYLYGEYKYTSILQSSEMIAKSKKIGMWSDNDYTIYYIIIVLVIILLCFSKNFRKKFISKSKKYIKKQLDK